MKCSCATSFCPHFPWAELRILRLFLCTQKAYFSQILFINLSKSVLVALLLCRNNPSTSQVCHIKMLIRLHDYCMIITLKCAVLLYLGGGGGSENQSVSGVTTICLTQCNTSPLHRVDQVVDCGLCNVGTLLFNGCVKLLDIGRNWNTLSDTPIQSLLNMLNGWHVRWVCWPCKNWDVFSFQELCTDPCNMGPCIIMLQHEVMSWMNGTTMGPRISSRYLCAKCLQ